MNLTPDREVAELNEQYARGEIDDAFYQRRWAELTNLTPKPTDVYQIPVLDPTDYSNQAENEEFSRLVDAKSTSLSALNRDFKDGRIDQNEYDRRWGEITGIIVSASRSIQIEENHYSVTEPFIVRAPAVTDPVLHTHDVLINVAKDDPATDIWLPPVSSPAPAPAPAAASTPAASVSGPSPAFSLPRTGVFTPTFGGATTSPAMTTSPAKMAPTPSTFGAASGFGSTPNGPSGFGPADLSRSASAASLGNGSAFGPRGVAVGVATLSTSQLGHNLAHSRSGTAHSISRLPSSAGLAAGGFGAAAAPSAGFTGGRSNFSNNFGGSVAGFGTPAAGFNASSLGLAPSFGVYAPASSGFSITSGPGVASNGVLGGFDATSSGFGFGEISAGLGAPPFSGFGGNTSSGFFDAGNGSLMPLGLGAAFGHFDGWN